MTFEETFAAYQFPFDKADAMINNKDNSERNVYYQKARDIIENSTFKSEYQEIIRKFYQELAIKTVTDEERQAYRLTLKFMKDLEERFLMLASLYKQEPTNTNNNW